MSEPGELNTPLLQAAAAPPPPTPPAAPAPSPAPPPPPAPSSWRRMLAAAAVVMMVLVGGAVLGSASRGGSLFSNDANVASSGAPAQNGPSATGSVTPSGNNGNTSASGTQASSGLVNITTSLAGGAGEGAGTGMVISSNGEVLTNNHVIENADTINVEIGGDGSSHSAKVIGYDVADDVALIKIDDVSGLDTIPVGNPDGVAVNDDIVVIGNALGRGGDPTETPGTVTALNRQITATDSDGSNAETLSNMIQVEADVQPGDSGGALVDSSGKVVGMTTAASTGGFRFQQQTSGVGFAIRIDKALSVVKQIRNGEEVDGVHVGGRALLGVTLQDPSASPLGGRGGSSSSGDGALVSGVADDSPAADAGIQAGDTIVSIGGDDVTSVRELQDVMNKYHPDDKVEVGWTNGSSQNVQHATVKLVEGAPA